MAPGRDQQRIAALRQMLQDRTPSEAVVLFCVTWVERWPSVYDVMDEMLSHVACGYQLVWQIPRVLTAQWVERDHRISVNQASPER